MRRPSAVLATLLSLSLLTSCQVAPGTGQTNFNIVSAEEEARMGAEAHPEILAQFGGAYDDAAIQAYVAGIGQRLVRSTETPKDPFRFTVLNSPAVNAFALPGGYVYVTRGLLALADSEAELAGVIGHEIGHVTGRHTAQRQSQAMAANVATGLLGMAVGIFTGISGAGDLAGIAAHAYVQGYSRDQESEADALGIRYMYKGGWHPDAMGSFLAKLRDQSRLEALLAGRSPDGIDEQSMFASHPRLIDRVREAAAQTGGATPPQGSAGRDSYLARIDGLLFGDDSSEGVVRGRVFAHAGLGIRFEVPPDYRLANGAKAVTAQHPDGAVIRFDIGPEAQGDMTTYLQHQWAKGVRLGGLEAITVNGMAAASGVTRLDTRKGAMDARLVAVRSGKTVYRLLFLTPPAITAAHAAGLRQATHSLRPLGEAERAGLRPLRVAVTTVRPGDTVDSLAGRMAFDDHKVERFRVLNGLDEHARLSPGRKVKLVM